MRAHRAAGLAAALLTCVVTLSACGEAEGDSLLDPGTSGSDSSSTEPSPTSDPFDFGSGSGDSSGDDTGDTGSTGDDSGGSLTGGNDKTAVCTDAYTIYGDAAEELGNSIGESSAMKKTLNKAASDMHAVAQRSTDQAVARVIDGAAKEFKRGAQASDPTMWVASELIGIGSTLGSECI